MKDRHNPLGEFTERFAEVSKRSATAARLLLGSGREHLVQEIVNDVLLALWQRQCSDKMPKNPEAWAYRVAWNRAAKVARMEGRYAAGLVETGEETTESRDGIYVPTPADEATPVHAIEVAERLAALQKVLAAFASAGERALNPSEARLFELRFKRNLGAGELASELGLSRDAVRQQWSRLVRKLLGYVRDDLQQDPLCHEVLGSLLGNEKVFRRSLLQLLRFVAKRGIHELEKLVRSTLNL